MSSEKKQTDTQRNSYQITINNPKEKGFNHTKIKEILITNFSTLRYFCMADEIGEEGTLHTHIYVYFNSRVRFSKIKKSFHTAHIEVAHGNVQSNIDYIQKRGKWEDTKKVETKVEGSYEEWGDVPVQKGVLHSMEELYNMINAGYSNAEIISYNNDYIQNIHLLDAVRTTILIEKYKGKRRIELKVIYISGATGTGKTRGVLDEHGEEHVYRISDYQHPFDGYNCQPVLVFDEFRSSLRLSDMLNYCDIYPIQLPARYANKFACYETVYIISNWELERQYKDEQEDNLESWKAFLRRINEVRIYDVSGKVTRYESVKAYFERTKEFQKVKPEDNCPF